MSEQYISQNNNDGRYPAERSGQSQQNPFLEYQLPTNTNTARNYSDAQTNEATLMQQSAAPMNAPFRPGYVPPAPGSLNGPDGLPVQGYRPEMPLPVVQLMNSRQNFEQGFPQQANILAGEQSNGRVSIDMVRTCNQIWEETKNPRIINDLLGMINTNFQHMGAPYGFSSNYEPANAQGMPPRMAIVFNNARNPQGSNRIWLQ